MRLLHGRPVAERINASTNTRIAALRSHGIGPRLAIVSVGIDPAANTYQERLVHQGRRLGIGVHHAALPRGATRADLAATLRSLSADAAVHGILLLTPLPPPLEEASAIEHIDPAKDVEGMHPHNAGLLAAGRPRFVPSTAEAILELLSFHQIALRGARAVVIGRSGVVGRPAAALLLGEDATVTIAHSQTADLAALTRSADVVVVAVGRVAFLTGAMLSSGVTVIDAGINVTPSGIVGDVDVESVSAVAAALSPVPGGLGAVTTALLLRNVVTATEQQQLSGRSASG
ncbi:MAG: bifunctional 5,10-methylenetetrahydrofolate dehydrogenase/5,10-methenyltetrahydrofolate cyclohydrolase [Chloroflexota bacterium]